MATFVRVFFFSVLLIFSFWTEKGASLERQKEVAELTALKFPRGASVSLTVALANHFPKGPLTDGLNQILEFDFGFPFPEEAAYDTKPIASPIKRKVSKYAYQYSHGLKASEYNKHWYMTHTRRQKRSSKEAEQENLLSRLENVVARLGYDGMACTSRFQCELSKVSPKGSLVEELLVALFKVSTGADDRGPRESCDALIADCPLSILHILLHSRQEGKGEEAIKYNNSGYEKYRKVNFDDAIEDYTKAIELDPFLAVAYYNRGTVLYRLGLYDSAILDLSKAVHLDPKNAEFSKGLSDCKKFSSGA